MKSLTPRRDKLAQEQERKVVDDARGRGRMLIPKPLDVDSLIRKIREGKLVTVDQVRDRLARDYNADLTCPLCTGIFLRIVAEAAEEDLSRSVKEVTPYWRVVKAGGELNQKFPGEGDAQAYRLSAEGHSIEPGKGKKPPKVKDYEKVLQEL